MSEWKDILSDRDIDDLMEACGGFHDSCIVSLSYHSGTSVDNKGAMCFQGPEAHVLTILFHSQWDPKAFELCFSGVRRLHLAGWQDNYFNDISEASLSFFSGLLPDKAKKLIVWADHGEFDPTEPEPFLQEPADTYVVADSLKWRIVE